ncbi:MAG: nicotinate (nicotinamide) nucleotide adenylyltransferase [Verrucomicrobia bacterium]|nr:nicotinate (nicotinamide) nucleotide adenylyltransferase [Verrucomicrobiota bacterium]MDE3098283.1 nicotinate (nicotinamide) nucleotide adenylyltransferase [Verrucomicrobiota bacterium]
MKLGIFGGSFDPIHAGHLLAAQAAIEEIGLDRLFFVPAAQSPFKPDKPAAPAPLRLRWLRLALAGANRYEVDDQELRRGGVSFAIATVRDYARRFPDATLFYLIGADHIQTLQAWSEAMELAKRVEFAAITRPGEGNVRFPEPFRGRTLKGFPFAISSSEIRARAKAGLSLEHMAPAAVAAAIADERPYG